MSHKTQLGAVVLNRSRQKDTTDRYRLHSRNE